MTAATSVNTAFARILEEGYGPGAWHGPNMKAALADVSVEKCRLPAFRSCLGMRHPKWRFAI